MAAATKTVTIRFNGDPSGLNRGAAAGSKAVQGFAGKLGGFMARAGAAMAGFIGAQVFGRAVGAVKDFVGGSVRAFSNLNESVNAVNQIFGTSAGKIQAWAAKNANSLGLSTRAFNELAVPLGALLKNAGLPLQQVTGWTTKLTERAADMASVFNTDVSQALEAIQAGLRGESDPLERFGVSLSAAKVEAAALAETGKKSASQLTEQEKATARLNLIMAQTQATAGDFRNTSDGLANSQRIAAAKTEELQAKIGQKLAPIVAKVTELKLRLVGVIADKVLPALDRFAKSPLADWIRGNLVPVLANLGQKLLDIAAKLIDGAKWMNKHRDVAKALAIGIAAVLVPAFISWTIAAGAAAVSTIAATAPILITIGVVAALAYGIIQLVKHWSTVWAAIKNITMAAVRAVVNTFLSMVSTILHAAVKAFGWVPGLGGKLKTAAREFDKFRANVNRSLGGIKDRQVRVTVKMTTEGERHIGEGTLVKRAAGGPVLGGRTYLVGERGPEILRMGSQGGTIIPNQAVGAAAVDVTLAFEDALERVLSRVTLRIDDRTARFADLLVRGG